MRDSDIRNEIENISHHDSYGSRQKQGFYKLPKLLTHRAFHAFFSTLKKFVKEKTKKREW